MRAFCVANQAAAAPKSGARHLQAAKAQYSLQPAAPPRLAASLAVVAGVAGALMLVPAAVLAEAPSLSSSTSRSTVPFTFVDKSVKDKMDERDEAMSYQCVQMFDCNGDRREFAKKQWADFVERGGVPERRAARAADSVREASRD